MAPAESITVRFGYRRGKHGCLDGVVTEQQSIPVFTDEKQPRTLRKLSQIAAPSECVSQKSSGALSKLRGHRDLIRDCRQRIKPKMTEKPAD